MAKRLSVDDREKIDRLDKEGYEPPEIAAEIGKDTRTVKRYLNERPRELSVELERQQQELAHRNDIRRRIMELKESLKFPAPESLDITDLSLEMRGYEIGIGHFIRWQKAEDGSYMVKFEDDSGVIFEHLSSSRRKSVLDLLREWQHIGGKCIVDCHHLRVAILKDAETQTKLISVPENFFEKIYPDSDDQSMKSMSRMEEGLLEGFPWTIYRGSLCEYKDESYAVEKGINDLWVLRYGMYNLAHCKKDKIDRLKDIHRRLINNYRKVSTTLDILEEKKNLDSHAKSACLKLDEFANLSLMPGKCSLCPGN